MKEAVNEFERKYSVPQKRYPVCEKVYREEYDTAGNYHWYGTHTGHHVIKMNRINPYDYGNKYLERT